MTRANGGTLLKRGFLAISTLLLCAAAAPALAQSALQSGAPVQFSLPGQSYVSNYYVDVDASTQQLRISVSGSNGGSAASNADVDLFVRYGSPFPVGQSTAYPTSPQIVGEDTLARWSHYHSISSESTETINVLPNGHVPLHAGRWYIAAINANGGDSTVTLTATTYTTPQVAAIAIDFNNPGTGDDACDVAPWNDATAVAATGGNPGTTLGQQRRNALTYAVQQLSQTLQPPVAVTLRACWDHLGGDNQSAVIAQASPATFLLDEPSGFFAGYALPLRYTWYAITDAVRASGSSQCGLIGGSCGGSGNEEIKATFNTDIGSATVIKGEPFYFGYTAGTNPGAIDFVSVAMHEITHGLGFLGLANTDDTLGPIGAKAGISSDGTSIDYQNLSQGPYDDAFDVSAVSLAANGTYQPFMGYEVTGSGDAARAAALVSNDRLRWSDPTAVNSSINQLKSLAAPQNFPLLYAPAEIQNGSTLSHTAQAGDLMNAQYNFPPPRTMGLAGPMLAPLGWAAAAAAPTYAQPIPSNWYDVAHSGHGFDFQLVGRDAVYGDSYILVFYSFDANGAPEWYFSQGNLVDGVYVGGLDGNGNSLLYSTYGANHGVGQLQLTQQDIAGSVVVDFNQASRSPACRNVDRSAAPLLGVMSWRIGSDSASWCVQPLLDASSHPTPDLSGHWYAPGDGGWGMEILDIGGTGAFVLVYYPDANGKPTWAVAQGTLTNGTLNLPLNARTNGFCRTCTVPASTQTSVVGNIALNLTAASGSNRATGTATLTVSYSGGGSFSRTNQAITTLSLAPGQ